MRVNSLRGLPTLLQFGPKIRAVANNPPKGLLAHDNIIYSLFPLHIGMRQYWQDFDSLEAWSRSDPHREWWKEFLRDPKGTGFWHEAYFMSGGMETVSVNVPEKLGLCKFAPNVPAKGSMFSARSRAMRQGQEITPAPVSETELYRNDN